MTPGLRLSGSVLTLFLFYFTSFNREPQSLHAPFPATRNRSPGCQQRAFHLPSRNTPVINPLPPSATTPIA